MLRPDPFIPFLTKIYFFIIITTNKIVYIVNKESELMKTKLVVYLLFILAITSFFSGCNFLPYKNTELNIFILMI